MGRSVLPPPLLLCLLFVQLEIKRSKLKRKMEVEMLEDDVFFAELSKRISLLITDDDEAADFGAAQFPAAMPVVPGASMLAPPAYTLFHHAARYGAATNSGGRAWQQQQQQCGSKGTGVFIPRSSPASAHSKKKGRKWSGSNAAAHKAARAQAAEGGAVAAGSPAKRRA